jgi:multidrug efflux pump subunit AcrA (membrane-fusion protein)
MTTTSTRRVVTVALDTADLSLAKRGRTARITFPSGQTTRGRISSVGTVAESSSDSSDPAADDSGTSTVDVTIAITGKAKIPNLEDAPVTVELVEDLRRDVLAVPVESLVGTAGGEYAVVVSDADGRRQVPVEVGLFADGYVEVEGEGLREGMAVEVPEAL